MFDPLHSLRQNVRRRARLRIVPYCSIGTLDSVVFRGRVLANPVLPAAGPDQRALASVARMVSRFTTFEVESIPVVVRVGDTEREGVTDREGYFNIDMPIENFDDTQHWIKADAFMPGRRLIAGGDELLWPIEARIVGPHTRRIVISDIDDTLLLNGVGDTTRTIVETIRGSYLTREPVPDTAELYQWLTAGGSHPIAYVSSSPTSPRSVPRRRCHPFGRFKPTGRRGFQHSHRNKPEPQCPGLHPRCRRLSKGRASERHR